MIDQSRRYVYGWPLINCHNRGILKGKSVVLQAMLRCYRNGLAGGSNAAPVHPRLRPILGRRDPRIGREGAPLKLPGEGVSPRDPGTALMGEGGRAIRGLPLGTPERQFVMPGSETRQRNQALTIRLSETEHRMLCGRPRLRDRGRGQAVRRSRRLKDRAGILRDSGPFLYVTIRVARRAGFRYGMPNRPLGGNAERLMGLRSESGSRIRRDMIATICTNRRNFLHSFYTGKNRPIYAHKISSLRKLLVLSGMKTP